MDTQYAQLSSPFNQAAWVVGTVISSSAKWAVIDVGLKSLGMDHGNPTIDGHAVWFCSDEHTTFSPIEGEPPKVGTRIRVTPAHIDPTVAMHDAITRVQQNGGLSTNPLHSLCAAISVGIHNGTPVIDLPYEEDSKAEVDMNVVMLQPIGGGEATFVEVQGTAEGKAFSRSELDSLLGLASDGISQIFSMQRDVIAVAPTPRSLGR